MRTVGVTSRGIRAPIIKKGDDLCKIVVDSVLNASKNEGFELKDRDVLGITESVVARSQGNYATLDNIASDVKAKFGENATVGLIHPILSRNRFSMILKGISMGVKKLYIQLSYPSDEVGNPLVSWDVLDEHGINPYTDVFTAEEFKKKLGDVKHPFTGVDYIEFYKEISGGKADIILANDALEILKYTKNVINADLHPRERKKRRLLKAGAEKVFGLHELMTAPVDGSGFHPDYGLLGSNLATDTSIKLFPRDCQELVTKIAAEMKEKTGKNIEVMVYGDGAFKDPVGGIWELADPVVSPGCTPGLIGTPNEIKMKYIADNQLNHLSGEDAADAMREVIRKKSDNLINNMASQGTTPRQLTDLLGSLCDLTSGSGDKGTPIILIQGYFDNYAD
jgi:F420-0:gamma-glutamyl ligase